MQFFKACYVIWGISAFFNVLKSWNQIERVFVSFDLNVGCEGKEGKEEKEEKGVGMDSKSNSVRQLFDEADETATIT